MASHVTEAFVFDAIRTPRGRGKASGSLYEVKPITLLTGVLKELQKRHDLDQGARWHQRTPRWASSRVATSRMYSFPVASTCLQRRIAIPRFPARWLAKAAKRGT